MDQRYFTLQEAQALIPRVEPLMREAQDLKLQLDRKVAAWHKQPPAGPVEQALAQSQIEFLAEQIHGRLQSVADLGCLPKGPDQGLVDFPARVDGREAYLCWKLGEPAIAFWHGITEGFPGRKPLDAALRRP